MPRRTAAWGIALFVFSLAILFGSSMLAYFVIRLQHARYLPIGSISLPRSLWISTAVIILSSVTVGRALGAVKLERQPKLRRNLLATALLAIAFVTLQTPALITLLHRHHDEPAATVAPGTPDPYTSYLTHPQTNANSPPQDIAGPGGNGLYGFLFALVLLHALHVLGGLIFLAVVIYGAYHLRYDHEHYIGVRNLTVYWHFLDVVWLFMFFSLSAIG